MTYWDTSALVKLYVAESDSPGFLVLARQTEGPMLSSSIAAVEALCTLHRKERDGDLSAGGARLLFREFASDVKAGRIITVPYGADVAVEAEKLVHLAFGQPRPVLVRTLDAIHLASALAVKAKVMVAADARLRDLASLAGLRVLP